MEGVVRRTDQRLRSDYPELITTIYEVSEGRFLIFFEDNEIPGFADFQEFRSYFNRNIRQVTVPVDVTDVRPNEFIRTIPIIEDSDIPKSFEGIMMTKLGLLSLLISKFPRVHFVKVEDGDRKIIIHTAAYKEKREDKIRHIFLSQQDRKRINEFLFGLGFGYEFEIIEDSYDRD